MNSIVITGYGAVSPFGVGVDRLWNGVRAGRSGIAYIPSLSRSLGRSVVGGSIPGFSYGFGVDPLEKAAIAAAGEALHDARLDPAGCGVALCLGTSKGGVRRFESDHRRLHAGKRGAPAGKARWFSPDGAGNAVAEALGLTGPRRTVVAACATGLYAILAGAELLRRDETVEAVVAGGADASLSPLVLASFDRLGVLSPTGVVRPFAAGRDGFVLGEGAGLVVLERESDARRRGARVRAVLAGAARGTDPTSLTGFAPEGKCLERVIRRALVAAGCVPADIGCVNAHGTGTVLGDAVEARALAAVFGPGGVPASSTKSMIGHLLGAAGAVELIVAVLALENGFIPPTTNFEDADPSCPVDCVPNEGRAAAIRRAMTVSFGFGGHIGAAVLEKGE
ncbi:MAG: beta-ketoacyl-[acyl-carrier-protein] synthase family protein [Planctomycetota bacterium]